MRLCSLGQEYLPLCVCVCVWIAGAREGHVFSCNVLDDYGSVWSICVD